MIYRDTMSNFLPNLEKNSLTNTKNYNFVDENVEEGESYYYVISAFDFNGNEGEFSEKVSVNITGIVEENIPSTFKLQQNFPNPFNLSTKISLSLPVKTSLELFIYDSQGQTVRNLFKGNLSPGNHSFIWNGKNSKYQNVSSGLYFYSIKSNSFKAVRKMLLVK